MLLRTSESVDLQLVHKIFGIELCRSQLSCSQTNCLSDTLRRLAFKIIQTRKHADKAHIFLAQCDK